MHAGIAQRNADFRGNAAPRFNLCIVPGSEGFGRQSRALHNPAVFEKDDRGDTGKKRLKCCLSNQYPEKVLAGAV